VRLAAGALCVLDAHLDPREARRWLSELLAAPMTRSVPLFVRAAAVAHSGFFAAVQGDRAWRNLYSYED
jgi:hypothetical protein